MSTFSLPDEQDAGFGRRLLRVGLAWRRQLDGELREYGLTDARWRPILLLGTLTDAGREPHVRQNELARLLVMDAPSLARLLEILEADGAVRRREDPPDRRGKLVGLTPDGAALFPRVSGVNAALGKRLLRSIPPAELAACERVLSRIERTLAHEKPASAEATGAGDALP